MEKRLKRKEKNDYKIKYIGDTHKTAYERGRSISETIKISMKGVTY